MVSKIGYRTMPMRSQGKDAEKTARKELNNLHDVHCANVCFNFIMILVIYIIF
jgi:hypothetical protein